MRDLRLRDIRRCLFGSVNHVQIVAELKQITTDLYRQSANCWEFDFSTGLPKVTNNSATKSNRPRRYLWTRISNTNSAFTPLIEQIAEESGSVMEASGNDNVKPSSNVSECTNVQNKSCESNLIIPSPESCRPRTRSVTSSILATGSPSSSAIFQSLIRQTVDEVIAKDIQKISTESQVSAMQYVELEKVSRIFENPITLKDSSTFSLNRRNINLIGKDTNCNGGSSKFIEDLQKKSNNSNNCDYDQEALDSINDNLSRNKKLRGLRVSVQNSKPSVYSCRLQNDKNINNVVSNNIRNKSNRRHSIAELYIIPSYFSCVTPKKKSAALSGSPIGISPGGIKYGQASPGTPGIPRSGRRLPVQEVLPEGLQWSPKGSPDTRLRDGKRTQKPMGLICERKRRASDYFPMKKKRHSLSGSPGGILQRIYGRSPFHASHCKRDLNN